MERIWELQENLKADWSKDIREAKNTLIKFINTQPQDLSLISKAREKLEKAAQNKALSDSAKAPIATALHELSIMNPTNSSWNVKRAKNALHVI